MILRLFKLKSKTPSRVFQPNTQEPTETSNQPIRTRYLGHVTDNRPIRDQYFLIRSVPANTHKTYNCVFGSVWWGVMAAVALASAYAKSRVFLWKIKAVILHLSRHLPPPGSSQPRAPPRYLGIGGIHLPSHPYTSSSYLHLCLSLSVSLSLTRLIGTDPNQERVVPDWLITSHMT
eukprot:sb/3471922/